MSTQKAKFQLFSRLQELGFTYDEAVSLRRIEMTLRRWAEQECGDSNDYASFSIERDEATGRPYRCIYPHSEGKERRYPIADREAGALRRLKTIVDARNKRAGDFIYSYHQTDPRGCALYILTRQQVTQDRELLPLDQYYTRGLAVCC